MTEIAAASIEEGPIPFTLYAPDRGERMVLFCREGSPVTRKQINAIRSGVRSLYIGSSDYDSYLDYASARLDSLVANPRVRAIDKASVIHGVARKTVEAILDDPHSRENIEAAKDVVGSYLHLIELAPDAAGHLLAIAAGDHYSFSHSINVCTFCILIGRRMQGIKHNQIKLLGVGGLLHDVGKTMIDRAIIFKPSALTRAERLKVQKHAEHSYEIALEHGLPADILEICRSHHERLDGSGYPDGLRGKEIGRPARIAAIADVYDALTSERIYGRPHSHMDTLASIAEEIEGFDREIFGLLLDTVLLNDDLIRDFCRQHVPEAYRQEVLEAALRRDEPAAGDAAAHGDRDQTPAQERPLDALMRTMARTRDLTKRLLDSGD